MKIISEIWKCVFELEVGFYLFLRGGRKFLIFWIFCSDYKEILKLNGGIVYYSCLMVDKVDLIYFFWEAVVRVFVKRVKGSFGLGESALDVGLEN